MSGLGWRLDHLPTPVGTLAIIADDDGNLCAVGWRQDHERMYAQLAAYDRRGVALHHEADPCGFTSALRAYFAGELAAIDDLSIVADGTEFQRAVWRGLRAIPAGTTCSYLELASHLGNLKVVRAVGLANGANPIGIVVPCHRVIGADGSLTGYGGGLVRKRWLLAHERGVAEAQLELALH